MKNTIKFLCIAALVLTGCTAVVAQQKKEVVQAIAEGTSTQLGQIISINLIINAYSTDADKSALIQAYQGKGSQGLYNALDKMKSIGHIAVTGTLGYDVSYIRTFDEPDGSRKIRFITSRPITFGEAWTDSRSEDYNLSMGEVIIFPDKKKSSGTLYPLAKFSLDKENELKIELAQNPWKLVNIRVSN